MKAGVVTAVERANGGFVLETGEPPLLRWLRSEGLASPGVYRKVLSARDLYDLSAKLSGLSCLLAVQALHGKQLPPRPGDCDCGLRFEISVPS